ncbi:HD-GYP domain-containing protein (c-di-GMP phosphodiesterase class II) [Desulfohalotomaculum tongense]|uniref:HD-GYP domain-containing protein n=1 Tax=Desulforadius tongensis TaxID=1216062 RepID=UPI00195990FB|nr:HD-GYP domain-containing protein [Desulforadius tongensis]MBM7854561.1 HD-GYP domain-containing protein (c-di-GMP phosphodiesterase class II) [Desulforadius tongensis]
MRRVDVFSLKPGLKVGRTIYNQRGEVLLKAGALLTPGYISKLINHGVPFVFIDDGLLPDIKVKDVIAEETRVAAVQQVKKVLLDTQESGRLVIEPQSFYQTVSRFTSDLLSQESLMLNLVDLRDQDNYTFAHSVNVCVLSIMTGITMGFSREELAVLGIGALLHDLGKVMIPDEILNKPGRLTPEEFSIMKQHPIHGYNLIRSAEGLDDIPAIIALQHHESYDGSGYPYGIKGADFHLYSQITAIADKFDALTANRIYRRAYPPHEAYEMCAASGNYLFDSCVVEKFLHNIAAYPTGTLVELNNGQTAIVLDTPKGYSLFPRVRVLFDSSGRPLPSPEEISLVDEDEITVVKVLNNNEVQRLLEKLGLS